MPVPSTPQHEPPPRAARHAGAVVRFALTVVILLAADLAVKEIAFRRVAPTPVDLTRDANGQLAAMPVHAPRTVVPNVLALHLTVNHGAVFGLGQGGRWVFVVFSVVASVVIILIFGRSPPEQRVMHVALGAVLAGALGNLYDRIVFGLVRDMLLLFPGVRLPFGWTWPDGSAGLYPWIFNVADVCLVVGLGVIMVLMYRHDRRLASAEAAAAPSPSLDPSRKAP